MIKKKSILKTVGPSWLIMFLILVGTVSFGQISKVAAQTTSTNTYFNEDHQIYILKNGDLLHHIYFQDEGVSTTFPIELPKPNATFASISDARIEFAIYSKNYDDFAMGLMANSYSGYFYDDLYEPWNYAYHYGYSHLRIRFVVYIDDSSNISDAVSWINTLKNIFELKYNIDLLQTYNNSLGVMLYSEFVAQPKDQSFIWDDILNNIPCGQTLISPKTTIENAPNKALTLVANYDRYDSGTARGGDDRWEYTGYIDFLETEQISINPNNNPINIQFKDLLDYSNDFIMPDWVNNSDLDIYLYKGAKISAVYPAPGDDGHDRGHIYREMEKTGEMNGFLPDNANFNFTDTQQPEPILQCFVNISDTTINTNDEIQLNITINNVGDETAYNIDVEQNYEEPLTNHFQ